MSLSSPNQMVWALFRSLRRTAGEAARAEEASLQRDLALSAIVLSVTSVEAFFNLYFHTLAEDSQYQQHKAMILNDLHPKDDARPKGPKYKLKNWPPKILGQSFAWQSGIACDFDDLRRKRNSLMHFTSTHAVLELPGLRIDGLTDTAVYDELSAGSAQEAVRLAEGLVEETFRLSGFAAERVAWELHGWTGRPPGCSA